MSDVLGRKESDIKISGRGKRASGIVDTHKNGKLYEVRVYEGSTDEHGNTVLGKLKYVIPTEELQVRADEFPKRMAQSIEKSSHRTGLRADKPKRPCIICNEPFVPDGSYHKICSDECRNKRQRNKKREQVAKDLGIDVSELTQNQQED